MLKILQAFRFSEFTKQNQTTEYSVVTLKSDLLLNILFKLTILFL